MYNTLKKYGCNRKALNIDNKTGLDILQARIKIENPYDCSLPATRGFFEYLTANKRKSLVTIKSCPQTGAKRFSGISVATIEPRF